MCHTITSLTELNVRVLEAVEETLRIQVSLVLLCLLGNRLNIF